MDGPFAVAAARDRGVPERQPHVLATPVPVPPGVSEAVIPATFRATSGLPTAAQGTSFRKNITLRFRTLNGG